MAPAVVPLSKLMSLFIKTLAKPMAKQVKHRAVKQPMISRSLVWVGQTQHALTTRMTIWSSGFKVRSISRIEDEVALSRGADLLSETFIFSVSVGILMYEYRRSSIKDEKKEAAKLKQIRDDAAKLQAKLDSLDKRLVSLEEFAKANRRSIVLGIGVNNAAEYVEPSEDEIVPINDEKGGKKKSSLTNEKDSSGPVRVRNQQTSRRWWWPF